MSEAEMIKKLESELGAAQVECQRLQALVDLLFTHSPDGIIIAAPDGTMTANPQSDVITRAGAPFEEPEKLVAETSEKLGVFLPDGVTLHPFETLPLVRAMQGETVRDAEIAVRTPDQQGLIWLRVDATPLPGGGGVAMFRDVTVRRQLDRDLTDRTREVAAREVENASLVERLRAAVDELSTPVLEVWDEVLALPVVGVVDTRRSAQMAERLLAEVQARRARFVIVDLTGVEVMDTSTADRIIKLARAVQLLGAECFVSGVQPAVAQTLVELGVEFSGLSTRRNLKRALDSCIARQKAAAKANAAHVGAAHND